MLRKFGNRIKNNLAFLAGSSFGTRILDVVKKFKDVELFLCYIFCLRIVKINLAAVGRFYLGENIIEFTEITGLSGQNLGVLKILTNIWNLERFGAFTQSF
jgi:hypothetical protein